MPAMSCVRCSYVMNASGDVELDGQSRAPGPGDRTICMRCGMVMVFTDDMALRAMQQADLVDMDPQSLFEVLAMIDFWNQTQEKKRLNG